MMNATRYILLTLFLGVVPPIGSTFAINYYVDPYFQWRFNPSYGIDLQGNLDLREEMTSRARISKVYEVRRIRPEHIALGSSRCLIGIDREHEAWPDGPTYNLSAFGADIDESLAYLRHAQGVHQLETVVLGLDFFAFNQNRRSKVPYYEDILSYRDSRYGWLVKRVRAAVSLNTLGDSLKHTIAGMSSNDKVNSSSKKRQLLPPDQKVYRSRVNFRRYFGPDGTGYSFYGSRDSSSFSTYRRILDFCHEKNIQLYLFVSPVHAVQLEVIDGFGLWDTFEIWKRQLVKNNEESAAEFGESPFPLWDFANYNTFTTEPLPRVDERRKWMDYFRDPNHYNRELGNKIMNTLFASSHTTGFGRKLTSGSIEQHFAEDRNNRNSWRKSFPEDFEAFRTLALESRPEGSIIDNEI